jgi:hypothetical protein
MFYMVIYYPNTTRRSASLPDREVGGAGQIVSVQHGKHVVTFSGVDNPSLRASLEVDRNGAI